MVFEVVHDPGEMNMFDISMTHTICRYHPTYASRSKTVRYAKVETSPEGIEKQSTPRLSIDRRALPNRVATIMGIAPITGT